MKKRKILIDTDIGDDIDDETYVSASIYPNYEQIKNNLKRQDITKEDVQKIM